MPDRVELLNRLLAPLTDAFIGVAETHGRYLAEKEGCPAAKVRVIPNGVDVEKFHPRWPIASLQGEFCLTPGSPVVGHSGGITAGKKPRVIFTGGKTDSPGAAVTTKFLIIGDGPRRTELECFARDLGLKRGGAFYGHSRRRARDAVACGRDIVDFA